MEFNTANQGSGLCRLPALYLLDYDPGPVLEQRAPCNIEFLVFH